MSPNTIVKTLLPRKQIREVSKGVHRRIIKPASRWPRLNMASSAENWPTFALSLLIATFSWPMPLKFGNWNALTK